MRRKPPDKLGGSGLPPARLAPHQPARPAVAADRAGQRAERETVRPARHLAAGARFGFLERGDEAQGGCIIMPAHQFLVPIPANGEAGKDAGLDLTAPFGTERRLQHGPEHRMDGTRRGQIDGIEQGMAGGIDHRRPALDHRRVQAVLGAEMIVQKSLRDAGGDGNPLHARALEAQARKLRLGRFQYALASLIRLVGLGLSARGLHCRTLLLTDRPVNAELFSGNRSDAVNATAIVATSAEAAPASPRLHGVPRNGRDEGCMPALELAGISLKRNDRVLLDTVSLSVPEGKTVAFIGGSGAGKTSVVRLIMRLLEPDSGKILLKGRDAGTVPLDAWRAEIALVPQETILLNDTIVENLRFGAPEASKASIEQIVETCRLDDLVARAPQGLQSRVGNRGQMISGGERQRIGLARALLRSPQIVILDEATSALDQLTEHAILEDLQRLAPRTTKIIVTHRIEAVRNADCIHVFEGGRLIASGRHDDLIRRPGLYRDIAHIS